jgi:hypothetical protein
MPHDPSQVYKPEADTYLLLDAARVALDRGRTRVPDISPDLIWQWAHGWPFIEYARGIHSSMMEWIPLGLYLVSQVLFLNPASLPIWFGGLLYLLAGRDMKPFRQFGVAFVTILALLIAVKSKTYYPAEWMAAQLTVEAGDSEHDTVKQYGERGQVAEFDRVLQHHRPLIPFKGRRNLIDTGDQALGDEITDPQDPDDLPWVEHRNSFGEAER